MTSRLQNRRDTAANWTTNNPTLAQGEIGYETDTGKLKIGTGSANWTTLGYTQNGTVTSIVAGTGLTGGTITSTGTVALSTPVAVADGGTGITSLGTGIATFLGTPSSANLAAALTDETGTGANVFGTSPTIATPTITGGTLKDGVIRGFEEDVNVVASAATGTINLEVDTASVWYYTTNATANHTLNIRYSSSVSLNTALAVGDAITVVWMNTNGATAYYPNVIQIDATTVTPKWQGGTAPAAGNASSIDVYVFTIVKTAATPTYVVLGSQTKFA